MQHPLVSVIIPTYNESETIPQIIPQIHASLKAFSHEILVVDDDSPDKTWEIAQHLAENHPVRVLRRTQDKGLSQAVIAGLQDAQGALCVVIDADLSHPPSLIPLMVEAITQDGYDIAIGSRIVKGGGVEEWPWYRRLMSWGARMMALPLTRVKDTMSGFFVIRRDRIKFNRLTAKGYKILLEILVKCRPLRYKEVPYTFRNREVGTSKLGFNVQVDYIRHLGALYWYWFKRRL